jgi:hypothetical protein
LENERQYKTDSKINAEVQNNQNKKQKMSSEETGMGKEVVKPLGDLMMMMKSNLEIC